ncbi:methyltransferase domain-containing protein [bacterium]|nr:methyltransferase domain-containing protein [bacterium]MBU1958720.1 methyltransferase domain-containing protein [bacterium]
MSLEDKTRWESKYQTKNMPSEPVKIVEQYAKLARGKMALDIACGQGRNSKFLAEQGFKVDALDISPTALKVLKDIENIRPKEVDFDTYKLEENRYDLIVCTYYLERSLFPQIENALKEDGILILETFMHHPDNTKEPSNRRFMLEEGELEVTFDDRYDLMHISEFMDEDMCGEKTMKGSIVAKKKRGGMTDEDFWA